MITRILFLLLLSPAAFADPGCTGVHATNPVIVVDRATAQAQGLVTISLTCTDGLPYAIESAQTPGGVFDLISGSGDALEAVLRDAETGAPLGPMAYNEHLGQTGTGNAQSVPLRLDIDLAVMPPAGQYSAVISIELTY